MNNELQRWALVNTVMDFQVLGPWSCLVSSRVCMLGGLIQGMVTSTKPCILPPTEVKGKEIRAV
jgi:hypothetical protein